MRLKIDIDTISTASSSGIAAALHERELAHTKHGVNSIEGVKDDNARLAILVEEVGEVANALTYDGNREHLLKELAQVMGVAWAWHDEVTRRTENTDGD